MWYVYVLYSEKINKRYTGSTNDLKPRVQQHNSGKSVFTSKGVPWKLIYYEAFSNKKDCLAEERFLKTGKGRERLKKLFKNSLSDSHGEVA